MTQTEALEHLEAMRLALQTFRSIVSGAGDAPDALETAWGLSNKWIWDDRYCPLAKLVAVLDRGSVTAQEFRNFMSVLYRFMPEVLVASDHRFPPLEAA